MGTSKLPWIRVFELFIFKEMRFYHRWQLGVPSVRGFSNKSGVGENSGFFGKYEKFKGIYENMKNSRNRASQ